MLGRGLVGQFSVAPGGVTFPWRRTTAASMGGDEHLNARVEPAAWQRCCEAARRPSRSRRAQLTHWAPPSAPVKKCQIRADERVSRRVAKLKANESISRYRAWWPYNASSKRRLARACNAADTLRTRSACRPRRGPSRDAGVASPRARYCDSGDKAARRTAVH